MNEVIHTFLAKHGRDVSELNGSSRNAAESGVSYYFALDSTSSLEFLQLCLDELVPVIGGDVLKLSDGQLDYTTDHWSYERCNNECYSEYVKHSVQIAKEWLCSFPTVVYFSFTLLEE